MNGKPYNKEITMKFKEVIVLIIMLVIPMLLAYSIGSVSSEVKRGIKCTVDKSECLKGYYDFRPSSTK